MATQEEGSFFEAHRLRREAGACAPTSSRDLSHVTEVLRMVAITALLMGCPPEFERSENTAATNATTGADTGAGTDCTPGTEWCMCIDPPDDPCAGDLVCVGDVCVRAPLPGGDTGSDDTGGTPRPSTTGSSTTTDSDSGGRADCSADFECAWGYVCDAGTCSHAWNHTWEMKVLSFHKSACQEGFGDIDPDYLVWRDDDLLTDSPEGACPAYWPGIVTTIDPFAGTECFQIDFWDNDVLSGPEDLCTWWVETLGDGQCGPIPGPWLTDGGWTGDFGGYPSCYVELEFTRVE